MILGRDIAGNIDTCLNSNLSFRTDGARTSQKCVCIYTAVYSQTLTTFIKHLTLTSRDSQLRAVPAAYVVVSVGSLLEGGLRPAVFCSFGGQPAPERASTSKTDTRVAG